MIGAKRFSSIWFFKIALSIFVVYHLVAVVVLPMGSGLIIRELGKYLIGYANVAGINTTWQFFSPGPSATFYVEYIYTFPLEPTSDGESDDGDRLNQSEPQFVPEKRDGTGISDFYIRRLASTQYLAIDPARTEQYFVPWLCSKEQKAESVTIRHIFGEVQNFERHRGDLDSRAIEEDSFAEVSSLKPTVSRTYNCPGRST